MSFHEDEALQQIAQLDAWESEGGRPDQRSLLPPIPLIEHIRVVYPQLNRHLHKGIRVWPEEGNPQAVWQLLNHMLNPGTVEVRVTQHACSSTLVEFASLRKTRTTRH